MGRAATFAARVAEPRVVRAWWRARRVDSGGFVARVVVVSRTRLDDSRASAPTTRRTARGERAETGAVRRARGSGARGV